MLDERRHLRITAGAESVEGDVVSLRAPRVVVQFGGGPPAGLEAGARVEDARIWQGTQPPRPVPVLVVEAVDEEGVHLVARDDASRAALWIEQQDAARRSRTPGDSIPDPRHAPRVPARGLYNEAARLERLRFVEAQSGETLDALTETRLVPDRLTGNIENLIGAVEIPVGLAGPLLFRGKEARGFIYAPFATTEGALVASATRGATALTRAGGVNTRVVRQQMMRVPLFELSDMNGAFLFTDWVRDHMAEIREQVGHVSRHANLVSVQPFLQGRTVHLRFVYETGDAAGQNMTTTCTWHACQWLMRQMRHFDEIRFDNFVIEANVSGDKKANYLSFISGRGVRVTAECFLPREVCQKVLKADPEQIDFTQRGGMAGSIQVGAVGHNINIANAIAAIFAATGQDIASVHECSIGQLDMSVVEGGLYASMTLPALIVGTVGGGTHLPAQQQLLRMMGCQGAGRVGRMAEIIAGFTLALDLSTLSAVASGEFANAHERLGRNRPVKWFTRDDLTPTWFDARLREAHPELPDARVVDAVPVDDLEMGSSIVTELTARKVDKLVGHLPYQLFVEGGADVLPPVLDVVAKVKPLDAEVNLMVRTLASMCGPRVAAAYKRFGEHTGFTGCHVRELGVYAQTDPRLRRHVPAIHGLYEDPEREAYVVLMERLSGLHLMDSAGDNSGWGRAEIEAAIRGIAEVHAIWYGREAELRAEPWLGEPMTAARMTEMSELWLALSVHAHDEFPEWITRDDLHLLSRLVERVADWWGHIETHPRTLVHNDFNPRNIALRPDEDAPGGYRLCAYDWELATLHLPQRDLAELLTFVIQRKPSREEKKEVDHYVDLHRACLEAATRRSIDAEQWREGFRLALCDIAVSRFSLYLMGHTFRHYDFMQRTVTTLRRMLYRNGINVETI